ncbi:MAG: glutamate mutase L, partial [Bacillota bacterium]|nr:glutamate mutase L [Bacillota bacterium]
RVSRQLADIAVADIGSTITRVSAFANLGSSRPRFLGQGQSLTTPYVPDGLESAFADLGKSAGVTREACGEHRACSTAGGPLRVVVSGTVYSSTVRMSHEIATGSGVQIKLVLTGALTQGDISAVKDARPSVVLLMAGPDSGEIVTAVHNATLLATSHLRCAFICAVVREGWERMAPVLLDNGLDVLRADEGQPSLDQSGGIQVDVAHVRGLLKGMFERHCVDVPGIDHVQAGMSRTIVPSPSALKAVACHLSREAGDLVIVDIGGSLASVCSSLGSKPRPGEQKAVSVQCDVEGDLGIFANSLQIVERAGIMHIMETMGQDPVPLLREVGRVASSQAETSLFSLLVEESARWALKRHAGHARQDRGRAASGPAGRDLSGVKQVFGTGGGLVHVPGGEDALRKAVNARASGELLPLCARIRMDKHNILTACGVLSEDFPVEATRIALESVEAG